MLEHDRGVTTTSVDSFVAVDVETANLSRGSICQLGAVLVEARAVTATLSRLVDPEQWFDPFNVDIHGITAEMVRGQPRFPEVALELGRFVGDRVVISHTSFDRAAFEQSSRRYGRPAPAWTWLDTVRVSRRAWQDHRGGYGLASLARKVGVEYRAHVAAEDAKAAAAVFIAAMEHTGLNITGWLDRVKRPIAWDPSKAGDGISQDGNPEGRLHGEVLVFTGSLSVPRRVAAARAAELGCDVRGAVNGRTTMLVVGVQDQDKLGGYEKSTKHRAAEALISQGADIAILDESDFMEL